jgi:hypothetical protein
VYTIQELVKNPNVIQRQNPTGVEAFSYLLLYSDNNCRNLQGLRSFVKGPQDVVLASPTAANVTCENSLLYLSNPNDTKCLGLGYDETQTIVPNARNDNQVETCDDNGDCNLASTECIVSFVPGCYQRWPSATVLFSNPAALLANKGRRCRRRRLLRRQHFKGCIDIFVLHDELLFEPWLRALDQKRSSCRGKLMCNFIISLYSHKTTPGAHSCITLISYRIRPIHIWVNNWCNRSSSLRYSRQPTR